MINKFVKLNDNSVVINQLPCEQCSACFTSMEKEYETKECVCQSFKCRMFMRKSIHGLMCACSQENVTTQNFKKECDAFNELLPILKKQISELQSITVSQGERRYQQLVHNIKSINAHCIQELYSMAPIGNFKIARDAIILAKQYIESDSNAAALSVFRLQKYMSMMKTEFQVYDRLVNGHVQLSPEMYKIRDVVMKTLHMFFEDFTKKKVRVDVDENYDRVWLDYETTATCFYYVIENATKYVKPDSHIKIEFDDGELFYHIRFKMISFYLTPNDREHLFEEGYSGELAVASGTRGHGIGMFRTKKLLKQCGADILVEYGESIQKYQGVKYTENVFIIQLPKQK